MATTATMRPAEASRPAQGGWGQSGVHAGDLDLPSLDAIHGVATDRIAKSADIYQPRQANWGEDAVQTGDLELPHLMAICSIAYRVLEGYLRANAATNLSEMLTIQLEDEHLDHFKTLYKNKINSIFWQAIVQLASAVVGGGCSIGAGFASDNVKSVLEGLGKALPQFGQVGTTFLRRGETEADGNIAIAQHLLTRLQQIIKHVNTTSGNNQQSVSRIQDESQKSFQLSR
jgi:hypothetical protein